MKFKYQAKTKAGELQGGVVDAANREAAINILTSHELFILSIETAEKTRWYENVLNFFMRVKTVDLMIFTRQFATLLDAEVPLADAVKNLHRQTVNATLKEALFDISSDIDAGLSLSQALERHPNIFSEFYISMIRSAEITGRIEEVMGFLADYIEKEMSIRSRVRNAMIYPAFIIALFVVVVLIMVTFVMPNIQKVFTESGVELPLLTQILIGLGNLMLHWWWAMIFAFSLFAVVVIDYLQTAEGKAVWDELKTKLPLMGGLVQKLYVARFSESISILLKGGIPVAQAVEISGHTIGNIVYRDALHDIADGIRRGELMSALLAQSPLFPPLVSQMVSIGESTGRVDELLDRISRFYTREVGDLVDNLVELIQPALIVVIGAFIGMLFASILLPLYGLIQTF